MSEAIKWYVKVTRHNHPRSSQRGQVLRSVLVMEEYLGRFLLPEEEVHHINGIVTDDRIENLLLTNHSEHRRIEKNVKNKYEMAKLRAGF